MFKRDDSAYPEHQCFDQNGNEMGLGFTKFEQCAKEFTAMWIPALAAADKDRWPVVDDINREAARLGILAAEAFCKQMEEWEKDES